MKWLSLALIAAVELGGAFGSASATVESLGEVSMIVDLEVEVKVSAAAVVAHLAFDDDPTVALPLLDRGGGVFGIRTELAPKNYLVVFEAIGDPGGLSQAVSLTELGADLGPSRGSGTNSTEGDGLSSETRGTGWVALALGAASLSALAFWVLGDRDKREETDHTSLEEEE